MQLQYDEAGQGPALILVHGLGGTGNLWGGIVPAFAREYRVICPDLRGSGRTGCEGEISTPTLAADLLELADRLDIREAHWVGHSYGSTVLQSLATQHPTRMLSLTLIGPIQVASTPMKAALTERAAKARTEGLAGIANTTAQMGLSAESRSHRPEIAAFVRELVMRQSPEFYARTCESIVRTFAPKLETLRCRTLVMTGDEDLTAPPLAAKAIADQVSGSQFHILSRCGHWAPLERAREISELLLNFLARNSDGRAA